MCSDENTAPLRDSVGSLSLIVVVVIQFSDAEPEAYHCGSLGSPKVVAGARGSVGVVETTEAREGPDQMLG